MSQRKYKRKISLTAYTVPTEKEARSMVRFILPSHWRITKVKDGWRVHITT